MAKGLSATTLLLIGGGVLAVYMLTKKSTPVSSAPPGYVATYGPNGQVYYTPTTGGSNVNIPSGGGSGVSTTQYIALGTALASAIDDLFG